MNNAFYKFLSIVSDYQFIKIKYRSKIGKKINLRNPKTFNEKINWLKLYDRDKEYINMVDKYEVKNYVANIIGKEYIIPTLGIYNNFDEIDFSKLPNKFVIKCTHDSGGIVICHNKQSFDKNAAKKIIEKHMKINYFYIGREWPYKNVKPRILIEKYMEDTETKELRDYKFFCFNGKVEIFKIDFDRNVNHRANYFNKKMEMLQFGEEVCPPNFDKDLKIPKKINKMMSLAEQLSNNIPFVRVDFYSCNERIFFGEFTFYPASGFGKFVPEEWDYKLGEMIKLPQKK